MVSGMDSFRSKFKDYADCYTVIGGAACDILMTEADIGFRATKDVDMILLLEDRCQAFASAFWEYIREGGYRCGWKNSASVHFYRFSDPAPGYPVQIELFSRNPNDYLSLESGIVPIHIDDEVSSLSAIILNDDFYRFMMAGRRIVDGICVLDAAYLIPFKMYAWINLSDRKANGEHVNERDLRKHKYDVFRLLEIVSVDEKAETFGLVKDSISKFLERIAGEQLALSKIGLNIDQEQGMELIRQIYK